MALKILRRRSRNFGHFGAVRSDWCWLRRHQIITTGPKIGCCVALAHFGSPALIRDSSMEALAITLVSCAAIPGKLRALTETGCFGQVIVTVAWKLGSSISSMRK
jgi:hypothetical protein